MKRSWVIAGGGTGGHVTPALALGEVIVERGDRLLFIGSQAGLEAELIPRLGFELLALPSQQVMGRSAVGRLRGAAGILGQLGRARAALDRCRADLVISVGGYAAMPAAMAAVLTRRPLVLVEPNAIPGRVNRLMARFARRVFVGFEQTADRLGGGGERVRHVGVPLRRELLAAFEQAPAREPPGTPLHLLVFGGSQGARQLNEAMMEIAGRLADHPIAVYHQAGEADRERVDGAYREAGLRAEVVDFEPDMPSRYHWADLAVCRAGALTVAELTMAGLPALLIPYPFAADDHQRANAESLAAAGGARCLGSRPLDVERLAREIVELAAGPERLCAMSAATRSLARPHAARQVVDTCLALLGETQS